MKPVLRNSSAAYAHFPEGLYVYLMCNGLPNAGFIVVVLLHYLLCEHFGSLTFSPTIVFVRYLSHFNIYSVEHMCVSNTCEAERALSSYKRHFF